jgi:uncharacterized membrane protein
MTLLIAGLALWYAGHFFKRLAPGVRDGMGNAGKGVAAVLILGGLVAMIMGYRGSDFIPVYDPPFWGVHLTNALMFFVIFLFGLGSSKSPLRSKMRHPMLTGTLLWALSHLLVNGDLHSVILFGGIAVWAVLEMIVINAKEPVYHRFEGGSKAGTVRLAVISVVLYGIIAAIHTWLGVWPFPG